MALWQVTFEFVFRGKPLLPDGYSDLLAACLSRVDSWSNDLEVWGSYDEDTIQIWREGGEVESITARLDARTMDPRFLSVLIDFAYIVDAWLETTNGAVIAPSRAGVLEVVSTSKAMQYLDDPQGFFEKLKAEEEDQNRTED